MKILCGFRLILKEKTGKEIPESLTLELLEKFFANNFALSDAEDNASKLLHRWVIAGLPLLRTLLEQFAKGPRNQDSGKWRTLLF